MTRLPNLQHSTGITNQYSSTPSSTLVPINTVYTKNNETVDDSYILQHLPSFFYPLAVVLSHALAQNVPGDPRIAYEYPETMPSKGYDLLP